MMTKSVIAVDGWLATATGSLRFVGVEEGVWCGVAWRDSVAQRCI